jgi:hypothetical protein
MSESDIPPDQFLIEQILTRQGCLIRITHKPTGVSRQAMNSSKPSKVHRRLIREIVEELRARSSEV